MKISFLSGASPIVESTGDSLVFYHEALGVPFTDPAGAYPATDTLDGVKHFGLWNLRDVAQSCFGTDTWPEDRIKPQACFEFDVEHAEAVTTATDELRAKGYDVLVAARTEPWGQVVSRLQTPEGLLVSVTYTPWMHG
jgi:hypothetical protein